MLLVSTPEFVNLPCSVSVPLFVSVIPDAIEAVEPAGKMTSTS